MSATEEIFKKHLEAFKESIFKNLKSDNPELKKQFEIFITPLTAKITAPYWVKALEEGRGPRKRTTSTISQSWNVKNGFISLYQFGWALFIWMGKKKLFKSNILEKQVREARFMAWYINKYGTKLFIQGGFRDIYSGSIPGVVENIMKDLTKAFIFEIETQIKTINDNKVINSNNL